ncbi:MAG: hypothetical protein AAF960_22370 [Bacteroidota bacterium]
MSKALFQQDVLESVLSKLKTTELERFSQLISSILERRKKDNKEEQEKVLLLQINNCVLPDGHLERFLLLREKRKEEELPKQELSEYFDFISEEQKLQVKRISLLKQLADLKGITVPALMNQLEITAPESV